MIKNTIDPAKIRLSRGDISRRNWGYLLDLGETFLQQIEAGKRPMPEKNFEALLEVTGKPREWFLKKEEESGEQQK